MKRDRISRENSRSSSPRSISQVSYHNTLSDDDDEEFELKSIHPEEIQTFITEPKFSRVAIGKQALVRQKSNFIQKKDVKLSSYTQGDFIARNIVLMGDARFYHALTDDEIQRVESIIDLNALDEEPEQVRLNDFDRRFQSFSLMKVTTSLQLMNRADLKSSF